MTRIQVSSCLPWNRWRSVPPWAATSARNGAYIAKAFVTKRIKPMQIDGKKVYQIGVPIHQGYRGIQEDADRNARTIANLLTPTVIDPNAFTPEFKGFLVKLEKV